jgi:hypothetical protein
MNINENELLHQATEKLYELTGIRTRKVRENYQKDGREYDGMIELNFGQRKETFIIEIKGELRGNSLNFVRNMHTVADEVILLICRYIPMPLKQELKKSGVNYLETAGNCYINTGKAFVFINDQQVTDARLPAEGKLWKMAGLKFLFAILRDPDLVNGPYRQIAEEAGIALGNVGGYLEELRSEGFLKKGMSKNKETGFIENKTRLIQRWAEAYRTTLRPKKWIGNFRFLNATDQQNWRTLPTAEFKWGGENAAALLIGYLQPEKFTLHMTGNKMELMKKLKLVPDPNGNLEMLEQFWPNDENELDTNGLVPPLLTYAELITSYDSRNQEAAERIKNRYLD